MPLKSNWENASSWTRFAFCGALVFWIAAICTSPKHGDPKFDLLLDVLGLVTTLFVGLRERKPPVVVTSLGLNSPEQVEDLSKAQIG